MADTPIETPLETARRVWPGAWKADGSRGIAIRCKSMIGLCVRVSWVEHHRRWFVEIGTTNFWTDCTRGEDLAVVLAEARVKVQAAVAELARAVGLQVQG